MGQHCSDLDVFWLLAVLAAVLTDLLRTGAQHLIATAVEAELESYLTQFASARTQALSLALALLSFGVDRNQPPSNPKQGNGQGRYHTCLLHARAQ